MLGRIDAELKLVIPGNHDLELDKKYRESRHDDHSTLEDPEDHDLVVKVMTESLARDAGVFFLAKWSHSFILKFERHSQSMFPLTRRPFATGLSHTSTRKTELTDHIMLQMMLPQLPETRSRTMLTWS